ncbi:MAG: hypothetical protein ACOC33_02130 [bacterium]
MSDKSETLSFISDIKKYTKQLIKSPSSCKNVLIKSGIYTKKGNLRKAFKQ